MNAIQIKPVTHNDLNLLRDIAIRSYTDHYLHLWHDGGDWYLRKCFADTVLEEELSDENTLFFIVWLNDEPAGFLKINKNAAWQHISAKDGLELERIYLTKAATGKGTGRQLVNMTFAIAKDLNKQYVWLKAMDSNKDPVAFYHTMGFESFDTYRLDYEQMKEEYRGMVVMRKPHPGILLKEKGTE